MSTRVRRYLDWTPRKTKKKVTEQTGIKDGRSTSQAYRRIRNLAIGELVANGWSQRGIAKAFDLSRSGVALIIEGLRAEASALGAREN